MKNSISMQKLLACLFGICFVLCSHAQTKADKNPAKSPSSVAQPQSAGAAVYKNNVESIVLIEVNDSAGLRQGSGVAIKNGLEKNADGKYVLASTWIVTNAHVVKDAKEVGVMVAGFPTKGEVRYRDVQMDIAFVFLDRTVIRPVEFNKRSILLSTGDVVFAIGAPQGLTRSITEGIISATRMIDGIRLVQTSAAISPGSSGGGLFTSSGDLAAITTFKVVGGESLNFAVEISQVKNLFDADTAASMMKVLIDPKHLPTFGDGFVKWVFSARGETGGTVLDEYNDADARWKKGELTYEKWNDKQFEIANRYYILVNDLKTPSNSQTTNGTRGTSSKLVLICRLVASGSGQQRTSSVEIDFTKETIDGYPAFIDSNLMRYSWKNDKGKVYTYLFDRNASTLTISIEAFPDLFHGTCSKSEGKAF